MNEKIKIENKFRKKISLLKEHNKNSNFITPSKLYESIIPAIVAEGAYYTTNGKFLDVDSFMNENFTYIKRDKEYGWSIWNTI